MRKLLSYALKSSAKMTSQSVLSHSPMQAQSSADQWVLSSDIFYLLNTIKIYTETAMGKLTLEAVDKQNISVCLQQISQLLPDNEQKHTPIMLSVCGTTLETRNQDTRVRAIPKAAGIRFFLQQEIQSDAYFYKGDQVRFDEIPSDLFSDRMIKDSHSIGNLCPLAFIRLLEENNARIKHPIFMKADHFSEPLSLHEAQTLATFSRNYKLGQV